MSTEFTWPYTFDTSRGAWAQIRAYSLIPLVAVLMLFPRLGMGLVHPPSEGQRLLTVLLLLGVWFTFSLFVFSSLKPVRGTVTTNTISVNPVSFLSLPTSGDRGTFHTSNYTCVNVEAVAFSALKQVSLAGGKNTKSPTIYIGRFDSNGAERLAAHLSEHTGIPSTDEFAASQKGRP